MNTVTDPRNIRTRHLLYRSGVAVVFVYNVSLQLQLVRCCIVTTKWEEIEQVVIGHSFSIIKFLHCISCSYVLWLWLGNVSDGRSQWPRGLRRRPAAVRLLRSWVRIPQGAWIFVCCEYCVLSGRGLCDELITRLEESYRVWCVVVYDLENLKNEETMTRVGSQRHSKKNIYVYCTGKC